MVIITDILQIFNDIQATNGRNDKERILNENKNNKTFKEILNFVYNPYILTGISQKKISKSVKNQDGIVALNTIQEVMDYLLTNNTGRDIDIVSIQQFINNSPSELQEFYTQIITKDLKIGITADTINKVFGKFIPTFSVMLAKKYSEHQNKVKGMFVITEKKDGNRCVVVKDNGIVKSFTRQGNRYEGLEEIESDIKGLPLDNIVFDGELIADVDGSTLEVYAETTSKARKKDSNKTGLIFHIFDMLPLNEFQDGASKEKCIARKNKLSQVFASYSLPHCKEVKPLYIGNDIFEIESWKQTALNNGWEGVMVNLDTPYVCKRTDTILKVKVFNDADVKVLDVIEGTGKNEGKLGAILIQFEHEGNLHTCNCGSGFSDEERSFYWENPQEIINKIVTIGYFEVSRNADGGVGLRFPTFKCLRADKTEISMN